MKRTLMWLLIALVVGVVLGQFMLDDPGYLLLSWQNWVLTTSLWVAALGILLAFGIILLAFGVLNSVLDAIAWLRRDRSARRADKARQLAEAGLTQYAEADWRKATSTLLKAAELVDTPLPVRLTAARAAEEEGRVDLAEQILREARHSAGSATPLVDIRLAALKLRHKDPASARLLLEKVRDRFPKHPTALRLIVDVYTQLEDWSALVDTLPAARAQLSPENILKLTQRAWLGLLQSTAESAGYASRKARIDALTGRWKSAPTDVRHDEIVVATYAELLLRFDALDEAHAVLEKALSVSISGSSFSDRLIDLYGRLDHPDPAAQLAQAEKWLLMRPTHAALLLATARISLRNRLWGKARDYLEASVSRKATPESCAELARLYSRLGESVKAEQYLHRQAELLGNALPKLPLPTARVT